MKQKVRTCKGTDFLLERREECMEVSIYESCPFGQMLFGLPLVRGGDLYGGQGAGEMM